MPADLKSVLKLQVPLIVQIAERTMAFEDVMNLAPGAIIELPKHADEELAILVNNKTIGTGLAVKVGENFGVRVTYIGDLRQRIAALGEEASPAPDLEPEGSPGPANGPTGGPGSADDPDLEDVGEAATADPDAGPEVTP